MSCGKKPAVKKWDHPKIIPRVKISRYEKNEASVKLHWKNVAKALELSYKDEKFWESNSEIVRELVGPVIYRRIVKIFDLPTEQKKYESKTDKLSLQPSEQFYVLVSDAKKEPSEFSVCGFDPTIYDDGTVIDDEEYHTVEDESAWSISTTPLSSLRKPSRTKSVLKSTKSLVTSKSLTKSKTYFERHISRSQKSISKQLKHKSELSFSDEPTSTSDDLRVQLSERKRRRSSRKQSIKNPHFDMLFCCKSETDMIKWKSKYKQKTFEVSASDEFSQKAEIMTKKIAKDFYDWWDGLGNVEFKSEIKRPEDIEELFQVWFDEHASRALVLDHKILPCVLQGIADYVGVKQLSCPNVLKRQIAYDVDAETRPAHKMAFGSCLPQKMKHLPPKNNTKDMWGPIKVPEDLRSMACVWEDIQHLTSTKAFQKWLKVRPFLPIPPILKTDTMDEKKQPFVVPSDFMLYDKSSESSNQDLALPVSEFSLELKEVLSKLLNK